MYPFLHGMPMKPAALAAGGYVIEGSAYGDGSSGYQSASTSGSPTDDQNATIEFWVKRHKLGAAQTIFDAYLSSNNFISVSFDANDKLDVHIYGGGSTLLRLVTTRVFRDVSAYMHIAVTLDLDNGTQADRGQVRVNGTRQTAFDTSTLPANTTTVHYIGYSGATHYIGRSGGGANYFHDSIARIIVQDGQTTPVGPTINDDGTISVVDASDAATGNDGFWFEAGDLADATATDRSSAGNDYTKSGTITATNDSPTDDATNGYGNYATFNPLRTNTISASPTFSNGNRSVTNSAAGSATYNPYTTLIMKSGQWYAEIKPNTFANDEEIIGMALDSWDQWEASNQLGATSGSVGLHTLSTANTKVKVDGGTLTTADTDMASPDRTVLAVDIDAGKGWVGFYDDSGSVTRWVDSSGTTRTTDEPGLGTNATWTFTAGSTVKFGASIHSGGDVDLFADSADWVGAPPSGFKALATQNLPAPAITNWQDHYYAEAGISHTNASTTVVNLPFDLNTTGGMVRIKRTDSTGDWYCVDTERGGTKYITRNSTASTEGTFSDGGFGVGTFTLSGDLATGTYVIEAFVQGEWFQIKAYTGTGSNRTVSYDATLSATPGYFEVKNLDTADDWFAYHVSTGATKYLKPNQNSAATTSSIRWNDTAPTTTGFSLGTSADVNDSGGDSFISYHWANGGPWTFGSYSANASADGPMLTVNGSPQAGMFKRTDTTGNWVLQSAAIQAATAAGNVTDNNIYPGLTNAVFDGANPVDLVANGIKLREATIYDINTSGGTFLYGKFGIQPFGGEGIQQARAR